ncbi:hypothetical protein [Mycolicibacter acidiphilus]|nr:hypothetical protein [Mycolicibacter acidiphilus]
MPETSTFGSQTLLGPAWVTMDEDLLGATAEMFEALAMHLRGVVVPQLQGQLAMQNTSWSGQGSDAASHEASAIINGHEVNATQASAIANKLRRMEQVVFQTKSMLNMTAQQVEQQCQAALSGGGFGPEIYAKIQAYVAQGLAQNIEHVTTGTAQLGGDLGVPASGMPEMPGSGNPQQMMQMVSQMTQQVGKLPQQLGKMGGGGQGMQQLMQPIQQMTSMFGKGGGSKGLSPFSNHPLTGGTGPKAGAGMARGGLPGGSGGGAARTPLMGSLIGHTTNATATAPAPAGAASGARVGGGSAPVGAGGTGAGGTGGMAGTRGTTGSSRVAMAAPAPLDQDFGDEDIDDDW